jgi:hypothetical protein
VQVRFKRDPCPIKMHRLPARDKNNSSIASAFPTFCERLL